MNMRISEAEFSGTELYFRTKTRFSWDRMYETVLSEPGGLICCHLMVRLSWKFAEIQWFTLNEVGFGVFLGDFDAGIPAAELISKKRFKMTHCDRTISAKIKI